MPATTTLATRAGPEHLGLVWIDCPYPVLAVGLAQILKSKARIHADRKPPEAAPSLIILATEVKERLLEGIKRFRSRHPDSIIVVFGLHLDPALARAVLRAGARGFIHAGMQPAQILRALSVASEGQIAAPRELLEYLVISSGPMDLDALSSRQKEILALVGQGLSNAQIAERLLLSESTIKQHLRAAYKVLGVRNRTEAAKLLFDD